MVFFNYFCTSDCSDLSDLLCGMWVKSLGLWRTISLTFPGDLIHAAQCGGQPSTQWQGELHQAAGKNIYIVLKYM
jgi:hypothetical protein